MLCGLCPANTSSWLTHPEGVVGLCLLTHCGPGKTCGPMPEWGRFPTAPSDKNVRDPGKDSPCDTTSLQDKEQNRFPQAAFLTLVKPRLLARNAHPGEP